MQLGYRTDSNLNEKDFIQEGYRKNPAPFWIWTSICIFITLLIYLFSNWVEEERVEIYGSTPFLRVTNREYSLFLWQNPEFMRQNMKSKRNYLEAWGDNLTVDPAEAEAWVEAPHEGLFLYHTWKRLIGDNYYPRAIPLTEFKEFLKADPEWHPKYWKGSTNQYRDLITWIEEGYEYSNLNNLSVYELPIVVRQAFTGWKNFTKESEQINNLKPTYSDLRAFVSNYPHFKRPLWINLVKETRPDYLIPVQADSHEIVPDSQMDGLLKMALYNTLNAFR